MPKSYLALLCLFVGAQAATADQTILSHSSDGPAPGQSLLRDTSDMIFLDYQTIDLSDGG